MHNGEKGCCIVIVHVGVYGIYFRGIGLVGESFGLDVNGAAHGLEKLH